MMFFICSSGELVGSGFFLNMLSFVVWIVFVCSVLISVVLLMMGLCDVLIRIVLCFIFVNLGVLIRWCVLGDSGICRYMKFDCVSSVLSVMCCVLYCVLVLVCVDWFVYSICIWKLSVVCCVIVLLICLSLMMLSVLFCMLVLYRFGLMLWC